MAEEEDMDTESTSISEPGSIRFLLRMLIAPDSSRKEVSVLILSPKWTCDPYGISTITRSLVANIRQVDPEGKYVHITVAVLEEDGQITEEHLLDAEKYHVQLRGAKQPKRGKTNRKPELQWMNDHSGLYFHHLISEVNYDYIIGHVPQMPYGCINLKDIHKERNLEKIPKSMLIVHALPKNREEENDDEQLTWFREADIVLSVGRKVEADVARCISALEPDERPSHKLYIPNYPLDLFGIRREDVGESSERHVLMMTEEAEDLEVDGLDFPLAVSSTAKARARFCVPHGIDTDILFLTGHEKDTDQWKKEFGQIPNSEDLSFQCLHTPSVSDLKTHLEEAHLFLAPLKSDSTLFGVETLGAIAAGVPVLVSQNCGVASLLKLKEDSMMHENTCDIWSDGIIRKLEGRQDAEDKARELRKELLLDTNIATSQLNACRIICESACGQLEMELDADPVVSQEHIDKATGLGIDFGDKPVDAHIYTVAFFQKLLYLREKLDKGFLDIPPQVAEKWNQFLESLEEENRKLLAISNGSVVFTLFCPTEESFLQTNDEKWKKRTADNFKKLTSAIGITKARDENEGVASPQPTQKRQPDVQALILTTRWLYDTSGVSMVTRSMVNNIRIFDPSGKKIKITCAVLEEDGKIEKVQLDDAKKHKVKLRGATLPKGATENIPKPEWMNHLSASYYNRVINEKQCTYVIGHAPSSPHGGANLKDVAKSHEAPKVVLMVHGLPKTEKGNIDKDILRSWLKYTDIVFSVGKTVESELKRFVWGNNVPHYVYIPSFPVELISRFEEKRSEFLEGDQHITVIGSSELDFELAVISSGKAAKNIFRERQTNKQSKIAVTLTYISIDQTETDIQNCFYDIIKRHNIPNDILALEFLTFDDIENFVSHLSCSSVFLYPVCRHVCKFGFDALNAAAVGVPILVSQNSDIATLLQNLSEKSLSEQNVVDDTGNLESDIRLWKAKIIQKLNNPQKAQKQARQLRAALFKDICIAESHQNFLSVITSEKVEVETFLRQNYDRIKDVIDLTEEYLFGDDNYGNLKPFQFSVIPSKENVEKSVRGVASVIGVTPKRVRMKDKQRKKRMKTGQTVEFEQGLTDRELSFIAQKISAEDMKRIAFSDFNFTDEEIDHTISGKSGDRIHQNFSLLKKWRNKNVQTNRWDLADILQRVSSEHGLLNFEEVEHLFH